MGKLTDKKLKPQNRGSIGKEEGVNQVHLVNCHRNSAILVLFAKGIKYISVVILFIGLGMLSACQEKEESSVKPTDKPVDYVFGPEISKGGKIYCAASSGRRKRLVLIAFKFADEEVTDSQNTGIFESIIISGKEERGGECDLSKLSMAGLADFSVAQNEGIINWGLGFFLTVIINGEQKKIHSHINRFIYKPYEEYDDEIESMETMCAVVTDEVNEYGFSLLELSASCKNRKKHFFLDISNVFSGVIRDETPPSIISCRKPTGIYPDGACTLQSWFRNHSVKITFSAKDVGSWRDIRREVFDTLENRLVALTDRFDCFGEFCSKLGVE